MFCIKCGAAAEAGNFCKNCFLGREKLFDIKNFRITSCSSCGAFFIGGKKIDIGDAIKNKIMTEHKIKKIKIGYKKYANRIIASVECSGAIKPFTKTENRIVEIILSTKKCDDCTKLAGSYYEAVLQIRGTRAIDILNEAAQYNILSFVKNVDNGYDIRVVKKQDASKVAHALKAYGVKRTFKLVGEKDGKKIYRVYYLIKAE